MMNTKICPDTGKVLERGYRKIVLEYKGLKKEVNMPGWYAEGCDEGIHSSQDMKVSDRALTELKAQSENILLSNQIKEIRKNLNLTQLEAGLIIGGGPRAFQKYEAGDLLPSKAVSNLLLVLSKYPEAIKELKKTY